MGAGSRRPSEGRRFAGALAWEGSREIFAGGGRRCEVKLGVAGELRRRGTIGWGSTWRLARELLAVEATQLNIAGDGRDEEAGAGVAGGEAAAELGGGDGVVDGLEEVGAGALGGGEVEVGEGMEGESGAADDDPLGEVEEAGGVMPAGEIEEGVGTGDGEEVGLGVLLAKGCEGVDGVVGAVVRAWSVERGDGEAGVGFAGEGDHGEAVGEGGLGSGGFEGLAGGWGEEDLREREGVGGGGGDGEVAVVWRVEGAAEEGDAGAVRHGFLVRVDLFGFCMEVS